MSLLKNTCRAHLGESVLLYSPPMKPSPPLKGDSGGCIDGRFSDASGTLHPSKSPFKGGLAHKGGLAKRDGGFAMFLVLGLLAAVMIFTSASIGLLHMTMTNAKRVELRQVCRNLAEAGVEKAAAELRNGNAAYRGEKDAALGDGFFEVEVQPGDGPGMYQVASRGFLRDGRFTLFEARVRTQVSIGQDKQARLLRWTEGQIWSGHADLVSR